MVCGQGKCIRFLRKRSIPERDERWEILCDRRPEFVLRGQFAQYQEQIATYSSKGYRVLVFAQYEGTLDRKPLTEPVLPLCFVMLANPIRKGAKETFTYFAENDVDIKVISGDNR